MEAPTTNPFCGFLSNYLLLSEKERWVTAGRDISHNFKRYFVVKIVKSSKPGADRGKFIIPHSDQCLQQGKKVRNKIKKERYACLGSPHCKSGPAQLKSVDLHQYMIRIDPTEVTVATNIFRKPYSEILGTLTLIAELEEE